MATYDPATRPNRKYLLEPKAIKDRKTALVKLDWIVRPDELLRDPGKLPYLLWAVTSSNYNHQLLDFCEWCSGEVVQYGGVKTLLILPTEDNTRTLLDYFNATPSLGALKLVPHLKPDLLGRLLSAEIRESVYAEAARNLDIPGVVKPLFPYQRAGVLEMSQRRGRALLADGMGLGKSIQALAFWRFNRMGKTLIICPKTLILNWKKEILEGLAGIDAEDIVPILDAKQNVVWDKMFYIINYDVMDKWVKQFNEAQFDLLILDEAHYIKNSHARRTKQVFAVAEPIPHVLALTGTPILNRAIEIWNLLHLLDPVTYGQKGGFVKRFTQIANPAIDTEGETSVAEADDASFRSFRDPEELGRILRETVMIRRTKQEVLKELPPKVREMIILPCDQASMEPYRQSEEEFVKYLIEQRMTIGQFLRSVVDGHNIRGTQLLASLTKVRQQAVMAKLGAAIEWIENFLESGEKLIVFAHHREPIHRLQEQFGSVAVSFTGEDKLEDRDAAVKAFQSSPDVKLIIISIKAGGTGITLTAASNVAFLETDWSPGNNEQAEDRAHRIGQEAESVNIYYLVAEGTIDVPIYNLVREKAEMLDRVHQLDKAQSGETITSIRDRLNAQLGALGLKVDFDPGHLVESVRLNAEPWLTMAEAEEYARSKGSKILRTNLNDEVRKGRLQEGVDVRWVEQHGGHGGIWQIRKEAIDRRIEERKRGRGRPRNN